MIRHMTCKVIRGKRVLPTLSIDKNSVTWSVDTCQELPFGLFHFSLESSDCKATLVSSSGGKHSGRKRKFTRTDKQEEDAGGKSFLFPLDCAISRAQAKLWRRHWTSRKHFFFVIYEYLLRGFVACEKLDRGKLDADLFGPNKPDYCKLNRFKLLASIDKLVTSGWHILIGR